MEPSGQICEAAVVAGDADYVPAVQAARAAGIVVRLYYAKEPSANIFTATQLLREVDERTELTREFFEKNGLTR